MKLILKKGVTSQTALIFVQDSSVTTGAGLTGLAYNTSGLSWYYYREGAGTGGTSVTLATATLGTWTSGGFVAVDGTNLPGWYEIGIPNAALATGADFVGMQLKGATNMAPVNLEIELVDVDLADGVRMGLTALPNAAADAAGGLAISDAGGLDLDGLNTNVSAILADTGTDGVVVAAASKTGYRLSATGVDDIFDEPLSGHVTAGSFGAALYVIRSSTAQAGASTTITLDASASATDDYYNNQRIFLVSGTGAGQGTYITGYNGTTKVATVQDTWRTNPSSDSVFVIVPAGGIPGASAPTAADVADAVWDEARAGHVAEGSFGALFYAPHEGTAQAATTSSITLDATGSSATDDFYNYAFIKIVAGTGAGQSRQISDYNGTTKVATVSLNWTTTPSTDSQYVVMTDFGIDAATIASIADGVWDEARAGHVTAGTFGEYVLADSVRVSGSSAAADGLEAAVSGATPLPSNVTQWLGTAAATPTTAGVPEVDVTYWRGQAVPATTQTGVPEVDVTFVGGVAEDLPTATALAAVQTTATAIEVDTQDIQSRLPASLNNGAIVADIQRINDVAVVGDGSATPFTV